MKGAGMGYTVRPLSTDTWPAFATLCERHKGVWGGCWCTWYHPDSDEYPRTAEGNRAYKEHLVREGKAHAALVFDGEDAVGWCQYGPPDELSHVALTGDYQPAPETPPDFLITCFFADRHHRRSEVAAAALRGALDLIAGAGGGIVEAYPHDMQGRTPAAPFFCNGTRRMFAQAGFGALRPGGKHRTLMRRVVAPLPHAPESDRGTQLSRPRPT